MTELWGRADDDDMRANCPECYRPDLGTGGYGEKFWGFVSALVNITSFQQGTHPQLRNLVRLGYSYKLLRPLNNGTEPAVLICESNQDGMPLSNMYMLPIPIPNSKVREAGRVSVLQG